MLFSDELLFVHVPKTGGESITDYLISNLPGRKTLVDESVVPTGEFPLPLLVTAKLHTKALLKRLGIGTPRCASVIDGKRHMRLAEIRDMFAGMGRRLDDFGAIVAVVRNPYDLEVSRYHYLRKGFHGVRGVARSREQRIALNEDFETFARKAPFHGRLPARIEEWYEIDGRSPSNLRVVRFENLQEDFASTIAGFCPAAGKLRKLNASSHGHYRNYLTQGAEEAIYRKFQWLFDRKFYARETFAPAGGDLVLPPQSSE